MNNTLACYKVKKKFKMQNAKCKSPPSPGASLLAFVAFITFLNEAVTWFGGHAGLEGLTFTEILGYMLWPVAFCLGVPKEVG